MTRMSYLSKGDSNHIKDDLQKLQNEKQVLTQMLANIHSKQTHLLSVFEKTKLKTNKTLDLKNKLVEELNQMRNESNVVEENAKRIEININERRDAVKQLKSQLADNRAQQSSIIDSFTSDLDQMNKQFVKLVLIHSFGEISDENNEMETQIEVESKKLDLLREEYNKLNEEVNRLNESDSNTSEDKWSDWPITELSMAREIFIEEHNSLKEQLNKIQELESE